MKRLLIMTCAAVTAAPLTLSADDYRFIISGDPVAAATSNSCSVTSSSTSLMSGALSKLSAADSLEARYRTWRLSNGIALRSDKVGMIIVVQ